MAGISSKAAGEKENKKKYNGIEFDNDLDLNTYEAQLRDLDPQVGKWWQIDPKVDEMYMWSTYASNFDNPVRYEDHLGDEPNCCKFLTDIVDGIVEKAVGTWNALTNPGETIKNAFSIGNILTTIADAGTFGLYSDAKSLIYNEPGKYIGGKVFDGVAYAVTDGASKAINFKPPSYVYRALTEGENVEKGLTARNPNATNTPESHVAGKTNSQWISTSQDKSVASVKYNSGNGIVKINLNILKTTVVDLSNGTSKKGMISNWAKADKEVLIQGKIPSKAIRMLKE